MAQSYAGQVPGHVDRKLALHCLKQSIWILPGVKVEQAMPPGNPSALRTFLSHSTDSASPAVPSLQGVLEEASTSFRFARSGQAGKVLVSMLMGPAMSTLVGVCELLS